MYSSDIEGGTRAATDRFVDNRKRVRDGCKRREGDKKKKANLYKDEGVDELMMSHISVTVSA